MSTGRKPGRQNELYKDPTHFRGTVRRPSLSIARRSARTDEHDPSFTLPERASSGLKHSDEGEEVYVECFLPVLEGGLGDGAWGWD